MAKNKKTQQESMLDPFLYRGDGSNRNLEEINDLVGLFSNPTLISTLFSGMISENAPKEYGVEDLKDGFSLRFIPEKLMKKIFKKHSSDNYSYLYKDGKKVSDNIYRKGGMGNGFRDGYCALILYKGDGSDYGTHVLIDSEGDIALSQVKSGDHLYHKRGVIATMGSIYYNLLTGEPITTGSSSISSDDYIFVECRYDYSNSFEKGVYKIDHKTGEFEIYGIE